jgi:drug/metabolite transporter (DMT)-like permease
VIESVYILASVTLGVGGQVLLKIGMARIGPQLLGTSSLGTIVRRIVSLPPIWLGVIIYGLSAFLWIVALSGSELGYAYPFLSLSYVLVVFVSWRLFHERITFGRLLGVALICFGVYIIAGS